MDNQEKEDYFKNKTTSWYSTIGASELAQKDFLRFTRALKTLAIELNTVCTQYFFPIETIPRKLPDLTLGDILADIFNLTGITYQALLHLNLLDHEISYENLYRRMKLHSQTTRPTVLEDGKILWALPEPPEENER